MPVAVRHADGRVGRIDVLPPLPRSDSVDAQIFNLQIDMDGLVDFRRT